MIEYKKPPFLGGGEVDLMFPAEPEMAVITELHPGFNYTFTVKAVNKIGNGSLSITTFVSTLDECK